MLSLRRPSKEPLWREEFSIFTADERYVSRRQMTKFLTLTSLSMFVPDQIWVTANFKEIQLNQMRPGDAVTLKIDAYPGRVVRGHVDSVQPGSGTAFSLLPAQNATGNYVKIVQRVPVKIVMDNPPADVALGPGMSVVPTVRVDATPSLLRRLGRL